MLKQKFEIFALFIENYKVDVFLLGMQCLLR